MPRENRKRGKKHKKNAEGSGTEPQPVPEEPSEAVPSWIVTNQTASSGELDAQAPFGYVDPDVKAYFRTVDVQIQDWQVDHGEPEEDTDVDPNEERRAFFVAALTEMMGKEKQLATDPDCSHILERMTYSMDDFVRRVFVDSLAGSYGTLVKHRFASHVCQTMFTVAADTISRESRGIFPSIPESSEQGELRTLTQLLLDVCEELFSTLTSLILDPFASHVLRAILLLLRPSLDPSPTRKHTLSVRSKKSAAWAARQGPMKSVFTNSNEAKPEKTTATSGEFRPAAAKFVQLVKDELGENEVRALASDKVASPVLQLLLEVEADLGESNVPDSLMDRVLVGIVTATHSSPMVPPPLSDYIATLLRDPTSSHLLETLVFRAPPAAFSILWSTYFVGKVPRLASHPVANFVLAKAVERCNPVQLGEVCAEMEQVAAKAVQSNRTGVLRAMIDRAAELGTCEKEVNEVILQAFLFETDEDRKLLVPCALRLVSLQEYQSSPQLTVAKADVKGHKRPPPRRTATHPHEGSTEPKTQGAILLQSLLRLSQPHNQAVIESIQSLSIASLLQIAHNPTSSRVLDALLDSLTVPRKHKRDFVMSFVGHFPQLVDDKIGSRVGDRCWAFADPYLREKIARSLIPHEQFLAGSYYGKYFARHLNLHLLQRRPDEWKNLQSQPPASTRPAPQPPTPVASSALAQKKRKRNKEKVEDEIDAVFNASMGKRVKKGKLDSSIVARVEDAEPREEGNGLADVLGAIRAAPRVQNVARKRK